MKGWYFTGRPLAPGFERLWWGPCESREDAIARARTHNMRTVGWDSRSDMVDVAGSPWTKIIVAQGKPTESGCSIDATTHEELDP